MNSLKFESDNQTSSSGLLVILSLLLLFLTTGADAAIFDHGEDIRITQLQSVADDLYIFGGQTVIIDGSIEGDLNAIARDKLLIRGEIAHSANVSFRTIRSSGTIQGSLRAFGESIDLEGYVGGSVLLFARFIVLSSESVIERSADIFGQTIILDGSIKGNTSIRAEEVTITGLIVGDLDIEADRITISAPAIIRGDLTYVSDQEAEIDIESGVIIVGEVIWKLTDDLSDEDDETNHLASWTFKISSLLAAFLFGAILLSIFRPYIEASYAQLQQRLSVAFATGFVTLVVIGVCLIVLIISIILLPLGLNLLAGDYSPIGLLMLVVSIVMMPITSFAAVSGGILFYSGKIVLGILVGVWILTKIQGRTAAASSGAMFLGLTILTLVFALPYVGFLLYLVASVAGVGAIVMGIRYCNYSPDKPDGKISSSSIKASPDNLASE